MVSAYAFCPFVHGEEAVKETSGDTFAGLSYPDFYEQRNKHIPLIHAAQTNDIEALKTILSSPDVDVNAKGMYGETALHMACALGHTDAVRALLASGHKIDLNAGDEERSTPLVHLIRFCPDDPGTSATIARALVEAGADPNQAVNLHTLEPPLAWAVRFGNRELIEYLFPLTKKESKGWILFSAVRDWYQSTQDYELLKCVLELGAVPAPRQLRDAISAGSWTAFEMLLERMPDAFDLTDWIATLLDDLLYENIPHEGFSPAEIADRLFSIAEDCDPNYRKLAETVLASGDEKLLDVLLKHGFDAKQMSEGEVRTLVDEAVGEKRASKGVWEKKVFALLD